MRAMGRPEPSLREELLAARARLTRQIELLDAAGSRGLGGVRGDGQPHGAPAIDNSALIVELCGVLREIDLRLSELA